MLACEGELLTPGLLAHPSWYRDGSIRDGGALCRCSLRLSRITVCVCASRDFAGVFLLSWRLKELKRCNYGSSEGEARLGVLGISTNLHNIVALCLFVRFEERATH